MKKSEFQRFQDFKKRHKLTNATIIKIMSDYALTSDEYSCSFYCTKYNLTSHVFYKIRDYTIIFMLVSPATCKKIQSKSIRNQISNNPVGTYTSSSEYYKKLIQKRHEYLVSFSNIEITNIALMYSNGKSIYEIARKSNISIETAKRLLALALANHLVDEKTYYKIRTRSDQFRNNHLRGNNIITAEFLWNLYQK